MRSKSLRRAAAGLSLAVCLSLLHVPAAHAKAVGAAHGRGRHLQSQPAGHSVLTTLWNYMVTVVTGTPPAGGTADPNGNPLAGGTADPNGVPMVDAGGTADPNGML
jgi:hypothetical protein